MENIKKRISEMKRYRVFISVIQLIIYCVTCILLYLQLKRGINFYGLIPLLFGIIFIGEVILKWKESRLIAIFLLIASLLIICLSLSSILNL